MKERPVMRIRQGSYIKVGMIAELKKMLRVYRKDVYFSTSQKFKGLDRAEISNLSGSMLSSRGDCH
jgi:hypothetical protein